MLTHSDHDYVRRWASAFRLKSEDNNEKNYFSEGKRLTHEPGKTLPRQYLRLCFQNATKLHGAVLNLVGQLCHYVLHSQRCMPVARNGLVLTRGRRKR